MYDVHIPTHISVCMYACKKHILHFNLSASLSNQYDTHTHSHIAHTVTPLLMCPNIVESL